MKTDIQDINYIEIVQGLKEGDEVVTGPYGTVSKILKNGTKVKVVPIRTSYSKLRNDPAQTLYIYAKFLRRCDLESLEAEAGEQLLSKILTDNHHSLNWWIRNEASIRHLEKNRHNPQYLSSVYFDPGKLKPGSDLE